jgi:hypothetical protein
MGDEIISLLSVARSILEPSVYARVVTLSGEADFSKVLSSVLIHHLERRLTYCERLLSTLTSQGRDTFFAEQVLRFIPGKIVYLHREFNESTFYHVLSLFRTFEKEIGHV